MRFQKAASIAVACIAFVMFPLKGQAPSAAPKFEVASVKVAQSPMSMFQAGRGMVSGAPVFSGTRVEIGSMAMRSLIAIAYRQDIQRITAPPWIAQAWFSVQAVMPEGATKEQFPEMLRALLEERFHLTSHRVMSDQTAHALTVAKSGYKLKAPREADRSGCDAWRDDPQIKGAQMCNGVQADGENRISVTIRTDSKWGPSRTSISKRESETEFYGITMPQLAEYLNTTILAGRGQVPFVQVIDQTGLAGKWNLTVERVFEDAALSPPEGPVIPMQITTSVVANELAAGLSMMGLKMEKTTAPVEMLIVDHLDQTPKEN